MQLFIANPTAQNFVAMTRLPEMSGVLSMEIPAGSQIAYGGNRLNTKQIDAAISHLRKYGMMEMGEIGSSTAHVPLVFCRGNPVPVEIIKRVIERNTGVKRHEGEDLRKRAAIGIDQRSGQLAEHNALPPQAFIEVTIQEEKQGTLPRDDVKPVNEGLRVSHDAASPGARPQRSRRRR